MFCQKVKIQSFSRKAWRFLMEGKDAEARLSLPDR